MAGSIGSLRSYSRFHGSHAWLREPVKTGNLCSGERHRTNMTEGVAMTKFILGFGVGVVLGMLFAPAKGTETRARLRGAAQDLAELPRRKAVEVADISKEKAGQLGERIGRQAAEAAVDAVEKKVLGSNKSA